MRSSQINLLEGGQKDGEEQRVYLLGQKEDSPLKVQVKIFLHEKYCHGPYSAKSPRTFMKPCLLMREHKTGGRNEERKVELHL